MLTITNYSRRADNLMRKANSLLKQMDRKTVFYKSDENVISIVFAGQYSAGKSTIIKMLTGREDIAIGPGITTMEVHDYDWNGMKIIDTPGIHTELRPDHDEKSYDAILSSDLLVFVITSELFDYHIAKHFRNLAIDKDKAGEMLLVVNKMDRASEGNTSQQQQIITDDLRKVISPYSPEDLNICFLDSKSYEESLKERSSDPEYADELLKDSGYSEFLDAIEKFIKEKRIASKVTTGLYKMDKVLEDTIIEIGIHSNDVKTAGLEENWRQQRFEFTSTRDNLKQKIGDHYTIGARKIRLLGQQSANLFTEGCKQNEVEQILGENIIKANEIIEISQAEALRILENGLQDLDKSIDRIEHSDFTEALKIQLAENPKPMSEGTKGMYQSGGKKLQEAGKTVLEYAYKDGVSGGMRLSNFSGSQVHEIVKKAGHTIGYKFKPWQAVKITKGVAIGGKVFGVLGVAVSIFGQIKADIQDEKVREALHVNRQNILSQFNKAANELEDAGSEFIDKNVTMVLDKMIGELNQKIDVIRNTISTQNENIRALRSLQDECRTLIWEIHQNAV